VDFSKAFNRLQPAILIGKMINYGFNPKIINIISSFLTSRQQCVKFSGKVSCLTEMAVGAPQGTKLGPIFWLIYVNDLSANGYNIVKYADDTTFYSPISNPVLESVAGAVVSTREWSLVNNMLLNTEKTVIMNVIGNYHHSYDEPVSIDNTVIFPSASVKFLGVLIDTHLNFSAHVDSIITKCNTKLFLMRTLKTLGLNSQGLKTFYTSHVRSILTYCSPAWYHILSKEKQNSIERVQKAATKIILPSIDYVDRLEVLKLITIHDFIFALSANCFRKISSNPAHPLFSKVVFNTHRASSRLKTTYRPPRCKTKRRGASFFPFFMSHFNK
jgi:hypothetical protein